MLDHKGRFYELRRTEARAVVLYFTANGCPIARQSYEKLKALRKEFIDRGVEFWLVNANAADNRASIDQEASDFKVRPLPVLPVVDWPLGPPDQIVRLPEAQSIPATGVVDYRYVEVPSSLTNDVWAGAAIIRPGNLQAVHHVIVEMDLNLSPGATEVRASATAGIKRDTLLYSLIPHMHTRGSWMKYEALYPDGRREVILSVPRYDFNWQMDYRLAEPKLLPAGTWVLCTGGFDNSARNPHNPNPGKRVRWGEQSFDEMFIGFMQVGEVPKEEKLSQK